MQSSLWTKTTRWLARLSSLAAIAYVVVSVFNEIGRNNLPFRPKDLFGLGLFPFGVVLGMVVSWRHEVLGSLLSIASLSGFYGVCELIVGNLPGGWVFVAITSPAFLFLLSGALEFAQGRGRTTSHPDSVEQPG